MPWFSSRRGRAKRTRRSPGEGSVRSSAAAARAGRQSSLAHFPCWVLREQHDAGLGDPPTFSGVEPFGRHALHVWPETSLQNVLTQHVPPDTLQPPAPSAMQLSAHFLASVQAPQQSLLLLQKEPAALHEAPSPPPSFLASVLPFASALVSSLPPASSGDAGSPLLR